jgi:hypothetical protein
MHISSYKVVHRTRLISSLNTKLRRSNSSNHQTPSQPTPKPRTTLRKSDYPNVKHWERRQNDAVQFSVIKVYDTDSSDSDRESNDNECITKQESGVLAFLEDEHGKVIDHHERKRLYDELRGFWNDNIDSKCPPDNWSSAGATLRDKFRDILEDKFPFLRLCAGRWKVEALWKRNYHSWKRSLFARQARKTLGTGDSNHGGKHKRKESESPEPADPHDEATELLDAPRPKKVKTGMASVPTKSQSQKVRQLTANAHLIIRRGQSERWMMQGLSIVSNIPIVYLNHF